MNQLLLAAIDHYRAKRTEALATLDILFNDTVGIGEHTNFLEEVRKWTEELSQAEENLKTLENNFDTKGMLK